MTIPPLEEKETPFTVKTLFALLRLRGGVPLPLRVYARRPALLFSFLRLNRAVRKGTLPERLKRLAMFHTAVLVACPRWIDLTRTLAREAGIGEAEMAEASDFRRSELLSPLEKDVLEYAEGLTLTPAQVPEETAARLAAQLDSGQLVELAAAVALQNFSARFNRAAGL